MSIDWMTFLAQIANFLILIWLLKRFLYKPVQRMIAEREQKMTEHIRQGQIMQEEALRREQLYESKIREFESQRDRMLREVRDEAEQLRRRLHDEAIQEANKERTGLLEELKQEKQQFEQGLREQMLSEACDLAGRLVKDLTSRRLEDVLIETLAQRASKVEKTTDGEMMEINKLAADAHDAVTVRTSFEPTDAQKEQLARLAIDFVAHPQADVTFEVDPDLILGIELISTSEAVSWSARDYLNSLQEVALEQLIHRMPGDKPGVVAGD